MSKVPMTGEAATGASDKVRAVVRPRVVCLCGSTRFYQQFMEANYRETMAGHIVLSVGFYPHAVREMHGEGVGITNEQKEALDELHKRKIDLADEVLVLNVGGYVGNSTKSEIGYAILHDKPIRWLEPVGSNIKDEVFCRSKSDQHTKASKP